MPEQPKFKPCEGFGAKKGQCKNQVERHFWLCFYCWTERESDPTYQFSSYTPPTLKELTIKESN